MYFNISSNKINNKEGIEYHEFKNKNLLLKIKIRYSFTNSITGSNKNEFKLPNLKILIL